MIAILTAVLVYFWASRNVTALETNPISRQQNCTIEATTTVSMVVVYKNSIPLFQKNTDISYSYYGSIPSHLYGRYLSNSRQDGVNYEIFFVMFGIINIYCRKHCWEPVGGEAWNEISYSDCNAVVFSSTYQRIAVFLLWSLNRIDFGFLRIITDDRCKGDLTHLV